MAGEDELVLRARLDHQQVLKALEDIQKSSGKLEQSSNQNLQNIGKQLDFLTKKWAGAGSAGVSAVKGTDDASKKAAKGLGDLRKQVEGFSKDTKALAENLKDATALEFKDPISGEMASAAKSFLEDLSKIGSVSGQFEEFFGKVDQLMARNDERSKTLATTYLALGESLQQALSEATLPGEGFGKGLDEIQGKLRENITSISAELKRLSTEDVGLSKAFRFEEAQQKFENLRQIASTLMEGATGQAQQFGQQLNSQLDTVEQNLKDSGGTAIPAFIQNVNALNSSFNTTLKSTQQIKDELARLKIDPEAAAVNFDQINAQSQKLDQVLTGLFESGNQEAQRFALNLDNRVAKAMQNASGNTDTMRKILKQANGEAAEFIRTLPGLSAELKKAADVPPIIDEKKLNTKRVEAQLKLLQDTINKLFSSTSQQAQQAGIDFQNMASQAVSAFRRGDASAEETLKTLRDIRTVTNETGQAFVDNWGRAEQATNRATVSVWKVGTAFDHIGVRSVGSIARVFDAFKALPIPILGAIVAVAGVIIAVQKLAGVVIDLGKKAAEAFLKFTKNAVEASKGLETLDRQLISILGNSEKLGIQMRKFLLEKSFQFGADLTEDFARLLVPLTSSTEQIEAFAEAASAISASLPGVDFENMVTFITQMVSGQFRGARLTLRMTGAEVARVEALQEQFGLLQGTLLGLQDYMDRRGIDFSNIQNSLVIAEQRLKVFRKQIELAFGDPVRDEIGEQLTSLAKFIDDHGDDILSFFELAGREVAAVVEDIGEFLLGILEDFDAEDVRELEQSVRDLSDAVQDLVSALSQSVQADDLVTVLTTIGDLLGNLIGNIALITRFVEGGGLRRGLVASIPLLALAQGLDKLPISVEAKKEVLLSAMRILGIDAAKAFSEGFNQVGTEGLAIADESRFLDRAPIREPTEGEIAAWRDQADALLEYNAALFELEDIAPDVAEAQKEISDAFADLVEDRRRREMKLQVEFTRRELQLEIDASRQREDIHAKFGERINELNIDWRNDLAALEVDSNRKTDDILTEFNRKTEDQVQDSADKKVDIERKFQERLKEIKARFDFDAQEAIRKNDAVALLQIRRREAFELQQAKDRKDNDIDAVNEQEARKTRDLNVWLERQRQDAALAEDRKLEDLITADGEKRAELGRQYKFELEQQQINEQRKRDDLGQWRQWELDDQQEWWDQAMADLKANLADEYDIIAKAKAAELRLAQAYQRAIQAALIVKLPSQQIFRDIAGIPEGVNLPFQLGPTNFGTGVRLSDLTPGGQQFGGFQTPGSRGTLVGERRPEPWFPTQAGVIAPHVPLMMSTGVGAGASSIDNSRNISADISTLDPSQVSPIQKTIMLSTFMDQMLELGLGI